MNATTKPGGHRRPGVASIIGTLIFVIVFMAAIGAQAYMSSLQAQSAQAVQQAQSVAAQKAHELLKYSTPSAGLSATDSGPAATKIIAMILKFENGTVYSLTDPPSGSNPAFSSVTLSASASALVQSLVPSGTCSAPSGTATCLSKYDSIVDGAVAGRSVGLVTSMGNTFWFTPYTSLVKWSLLTSFPPPCPSGQFVSALGVTPTCAPAGDLVRLCTATSTGGLASLACPSLPSYAFYTVQLSGEDTGAYPYGLKVYFNGDTSGVYSENNPDGLNSNCPAARGDSGLTVQLYNDGYAAFTMNIAALSGSGYLATWNSMTISAPLSNSYPEVCDGAGTYTTTSPLSSLTVTVPSGTWDPGSTLTVYGLDS